MEEREKRKLKTLKAKAKYIGKEAKRKPKQKILSCWSDINRR